MNGERKLNQNAVAIPCDSTIRDKSRIKDETEAPTRRKILQSICTVGAIPIAGCSSDTDNKSQQSDKEPQKRTVVRLAGEERKTGYFDAEAGDEIEILIRNVEGTRTHVVVNLGFKSIFSKGVLEEDSFRVQIEESGTYEVTLSPTDNKPGTSGSVEIVLYERENSTSTPTDGDQKPEAVVRNWIKENQSEFQSAMETYESANEKYEEEFYAHAEGLFADSESAYDQLTDLTVTESSGAQEGSDLSSYFAELSMFTQTMRESSRYKKYSARLHSDPSSSALTGRDPSKSGDADYWWREGVKAFEKARSRIRTLDKKLSRDDQVEG